MKVETKRLIIDDIRPEDRKDYFANISHDKEVLKTFICIYQEDLETFDFSRYLGRDDIFAIRDKESQKLIGIFVECDVNEENKSLEVGYGFGSSFWGRGYATEALKGMLSYYFEQVGMRTVYASFFPENTASKHVMEKCGMVFSHINEKELTYLDKERDLVYFVRNNTSEEDIMARDEKIIEDCCFVNGKNWFRYRTGAIIVEDNKALFVTDDTIDYYYTVGGGVHLGESSEDCVKREVAEETGVDYEVDHLAAIVENFFDGHGGSMEGKDCHCLEFYFLMKSKGNTELNSNSINAVGALEHMVWIPIEDIESYNVKPSFLKERLKEIVKSDKVLHIVTDVDRNVKR